MTGPAKKRSIDAELAALHALRSEPMTPAVIEQIRGALGSAKAIVVERAAAIAKERDLTELGRELVAAFERFLQDPVKRDPGCRAKLAALEALDFVDHADPGPFLTAARHVQMEPADTATGLRSRALMALARRSHQDLPLIAGELLADREWPVRQAAADALVVLGDRAAASALALKIASGDEDPLVVTACASALLALAPDWALPRFRTHIFGKDELLRETVALALGQSRLDGARALLAELLELAPTSGERAVAMRALGLHRSEESLVLLLARIESGPLADAKVAVEALVPRRFEPAVPARVAAAVAANGAETIEAVFRELFLDRG